MIFKLLFTPIQLYIHFKIKDAEAREDIRLTIEGFSAFIEDEMQVLKEREKYRKFDNVVSLDDWKRDY